MNGRFQMIKNSVENKVETDIENSCITNRIVNSKTYQLVREHRNNCAAWKKGELCWDCFGGGLSKFSTNLLKDKQFLENMFANQFYNATKVLITTQKKFMEINKEYVTNSLKFDHQILDQIFKYNYLLGTLEAHKNSDKPIKEFIAELQSKTECISPNKKREWFYG